LAAPDKISLIMNKSSKWMAIAASLIPLVLFLLPMWYITITAPQYPNGLTMFIWINKITGDTPATLQNINILNHYVGMKYIEPDTIPELTYFPYVVIGIVFTGLICAFSGKRNLVLVWVVTFAILGSLGIYDFYLWEYDYGHNLSETAPIKIPDMVYQPPLFGSKMLLNFEAVSYPALGGIGMGLSIMLGFFSFFRSKKKS